MTNKGNIKRNVIIVLGGLSVALAVTATRYQKQMPNRGIAALSSEFPFTINEPVVKAAKIKEELLVSCDLAGDEARTLADSSQVVMLKFKKCDSYSNKKAVSYAIKNATNGYQGHVFSGKVASQSAQLSTDYIQLDNGENIIEFEIRLNDGQKINKKIKINRLASF